MRNENGYALVLVLVIITITFTFALTMSGMAISARKQFTKTDQMNKATDLAEMGVAHYETILAGIVQDANAKADADVENTKQNNGNGKKNRNVEGYDEFFYENLKNTIALAQYQELTKMVETDHSYRIAEVNISTLSNSDPIIITFKSEGRASAEKKTLYTTIKIEKNGYLLIGEPSPLPKDYQGIESNSIELKAQDKHKTYNSSTYFKEKIQIRGNRILTINGNAFFEKQIEFMGSADVIVNGDAIFMVKPNFNNQAYSFCVYGNTYLVEDGKLVPYTDFSPGKNKSCPRPQDDEWYINPDEGLDVQY